MKNQTIRFFLPALAVVFVGGLFSACSGSSPVFVGNDAGDGRPPAGSGGSGTGGGAGGAAGNAGSGGTIGSGGAAGGGSGGTTGTGGTMSGTGGFVNPETGTAGNSGSGGAAGSGGAGAGAEIIKVVPTAGCGKDPSATGRGTIATMGTKPANCADSQCGPWMYTREYFLNLPQGYDKTKAYPLVFQGPNCGGTGMNVYPLNNNVDNTVIRVGLTPPPDAIGHPTNPGVGCFDDREGDDSVDWVLYENLYDKLAGQLCFDKNRVFASGVGSGSGFANELGCKYAGDATRPIRGIATTAFGLPTDPRYVPTCTSKGMAGMWIHDDSLPGAPHLAGIQRAMRVNGCSGTTFDPAMTDPFPIGGGNPEPTCKKLRGCPALYPLAVCELTGGGTHDGVANPGFATFIKLFSAPPLLTP